MSKFLKTSLILLVLIIIFGISVLILNSNGYFKDKNNLELTKSDIHNIYLSDKEKRMGTLDYKVYDKKGISLSFQSGFNIVNNNILEINGKFNSDRVFLNNNYCNNFKCGNIGYFLEKIYSTNNSTYFYIKKKPIQNDENIDINNIKIESKFINIYFGTNASIEYVNNIKIYKNTYKVIYFNFLTIINIIYNYIIDNLLIYLLVLIIYISLIFFLKKKLDFIFKRFHLFYILLSITVFIISLFYLYKTGYYIVYDEYYTWVTIKQSFKDIIISTSGDVHPPFFYFYVKILSFIFGDNLILLKIVNLFLIFPLFYFLYKFYKLIFQKDYKLYLLLTIIFLGLNSYFLVFSIMLRMYLLGIVILIASSYYLLHFLNKLVLNKNILIFKKYLVYDYSLLIYVLLSILGLYLHNYFLFFIIVQFLYTLYFLYYKNKLKNYYKFVFITYIIIFIFYLPWLLVLFNQAGNVSDNYWIRDFGIENLSQFFINFIFYLNNQAHIKIDIIYLYLSPLVFIGLYFLSKNFVSNNKINFINKTYILFIFYIPIIFSSLYSIFISPIFQERYLFFLLIFYILFFLFISYKKLLLLYFILILIFINNFGLKYLNDKGNDITIELKKLIEINDFDLIINKSETTLFLSNYIIENNNFEIQNSIYIDSIDYENRKANNAWSLYYLYKNITNKNIEKINNKTILLLGYTNKEIMIPSNWELKEINRLNDIEYKVYMAK